MANPITWRNVSSPNFSSANALLKSASENIANSFDGLANTASDVEQQFRDQFQAGYDRRTNDFLSQINMQNDVNTYGQFDNRLRSELSGLDPSTVDMNKILSTLDSRENELQADWNADQLFADQRQEVNSRKKVGDITAAIARKDFDLADTLINQGNESGILSGKQFADLTGESREAREAKRLKDQRNVVGNILMDVTSKAGSEYDAVEMFANELKANGIDGEVAEGALPKVRPLFNVFNGLSEQDQKLVDAQQLMMMQNVDGTFANRREALSLEYNVDNLPYQITMGKPEITANERIRREGNSKWQMVWNGFDDAAEQLKMDVDTVRLDFFKDDGNGNPTNELRKEPPKGFVKDEKDLVYWEAAKQIVSEPKYKNIYEQVKDDALMEAAEADPGEYEQGKMYQSILRKKLNEAAISIARQVEYQTQKKLLDQEEVQELRRTFQEALTFEEQVRKNATRTGDVLYGQ